ncbi:MAG: hypothetical protein HXY35_12945 [Chloroflexi bacterium]|nr:hypothetical protein [Chloroflexota bacterium]
MKFYLGLILGALGASIAAWLYAERIVRVKENLRKENRKRGTPLVGRYKGQLKFITPQEASLIPEGETIFQYPKKSQLKRKPYDNKKENLWDLSYHEYIVKRKLENPEAWVAFSKERFDKKANMQIRIGSLTDDDREAFYEAMKRRRKKILAK